MIFFFFFFNKENLLTIIPTTSTPAIFMWCAVQIGVTLEFTIKRGNKHYLKSLKIIEYTQKVTWKVCRKWTALFQKLFDLSLGKMPMNQIKAVLFEKSFKFILNVWWCYEVIVLRSFTYPSACEMEWTFFFAKFI